MGDFDSLGLSRRARGVDHVGQIFGEVFDTRRFAFAIKGSEILLVAKNHVAGNKAFAFAQRLARNFDLHASVLDLKLEARTRVCWFEGQIRRARPHDSQGGNDKSHRALQVKRHNGIARHAGQEQVLREPTGAPVQFGVRDLETRLGNGESGWVPSDLLLEESCNR